MYTICVRIILTNITAYISSYWNSKRKEHKQTILSGFFGRFFFRSLRCWVWVSVFVLLFKWGYSFVFCFIRHWFFLLNFVYLTKENSFCRIFVPQKLIYLRIKIIIAFFATFFLFFSSLHFPVFIAIFFFALN